MIAQREAERKAVNKRKTDYAAGLRKGDTGVGEAPLGINIRLQQRLYQIKPDINCTYIEHKNRSFTACLQSYQYGAEKEVLILQQNKRPPTKAVVMSFMKELSVAEIKNYRNKIFRILRNSGLEAVASIELTRTRRKTGKPNNRVHFHLLTDDKRSKKELVALLIKA